ncbi:MAG: CDP-2,3-bis-(O-geranylgeranyl)-sn-glycerol synthase [Methanosarcinales archaeon]|nr:CDP-2,3-bis-(O-geranylgeranyl)-sn-glycerol synthase [Methanosarcinales archaeon]
MNLLITAIWLMLPAYLPNNFAALLGGGTPLDFGRNFKDGRRVFGSGKTFRGTIAGITIGFMVGIGQNAVAPMLGLPGFGSGLQMFLVLLGLSAGAMLGDLVASFLKRRLGMERGQSLIMVDQLDFVMGCWILTFLLAPEWFFSNFTSPVVVAVLIITPVLHRLSNIIGYKIGAKKEPW